MVGALPIGFLRLVGLIRSKFLSDRMHGSEGAAISGERLDALRTGVLYGLAGLGSCPWLTHMRCSAC